MKAAFKFSSGEIDLEAAVRRAIDVLSRNPRGFFLMVESDLHTEELVRGLERTVVLDRAIRETADRMGDQTLILFTADHSYDLRVHSGRRGTPLVPALDHRDGQAGSNRWPVRLGLHGKVRQSVTPLDRPNNVDVEYGVIVAGRPTDIAVTTERMRHRLRVFAIAGEGVLTDLAPEGLPVLERQSGEAAEPMGIALYKRPRDGAVFAIVAPKTGGATDYLWQYRLHSDAGGRLQARLVRRFGRFSGVGGSPDESGEIEAIVVDDALGYVYFSDERNGIRKYHAAPDHAQAGVELAVLGPDGYLGDREGLAVYETSGGTGFLVSSDQVPDGTRVRLYRREGAPGNAHDHSEFWTVPTMSDDTDGLEVTSRALPGFPSGMLVMMHSKARTFLLYDWRTVVTAPEGPQAPASQHWN